MLFEVRKVEFDYLLFLWAKLRCIIILNWNTSEILYAVVWSCMDVGTILMQDNEVGKGKK